MSKIFNFKFTLFFLPLNLLFPSLALPHGTSHDLPTAFSRP